MSQPGSLKASQIAGSFAPRRSQLEKMASANRALARSASVRTQSNQCEPSNVAPANIASVKFMLAIRLPVKSTRSHVALGIAPSTSSPCTNRDPVSTSPSAVELPQTACSRSQSSQAAPSSRQSTSLS